MVESSPEAVGPAKVDRRKSTGFSFARAYRLEALLVTGLLCVVGGVIIVVMRMSNGVGPQTEVSSVVVKELLDNLKILLGALITWGTMMMNGTKKEK